MKKPVILLLSLLVLWGGISFGRGRSAGRKLPGSDPKPMPQAPAAPRTSTPAPAPVPATETPKAVGDPVLPTEVEITLTRILSAINDQFPSLGVKPKPAGAIK